MKQQHFVKKAAALTLALAAIAPVHAAPGDLDGTFGVGGTVITNVGDMRVAFSIAVQADGKIILGGCVADNGGQDCYFSLARFTSAGLLDTSFGIGGIVTTDFEGESANVQGVVIQPDGRIVAVGYRDITNATGQVRRDFAVARYTDNGDLDPSFSGDGKKTETWSNDASADASASAVALQSDGKIVVVGSHRVIPTSNFNFAVARYTTTGGLDPDFDADGKKVTDFGGGEYARDVAIQSDGKIVVVGEAYIPGVTANDLFDFATARYTSNGSLDSNFSGDGKLTTDVGGESDYASAVAVQPDGKILVGGTMKDVYDWDFALVRYTSTGTPDSSFSGDGLARSGHDFFGQISGDSVADLVLQPDGKIIIGGGTGASDADFAIKRFNTNGSPDPSFNADLFARGLVRTDFVGDDILTDIVRLPNGMILAVGHGYDSGNSRFVLMARYLTN